MKAQFLLSVVILIASSTPGFGQLSPPRRPLGFFYGGGARDTSVEVVAYLDLTCPDSKAVYPTLLQIAEHYDPSQVQLRLHMFPLPYHRNSQVLSRAAYVLDAQFPDNNTAFQWTSLVFDHIGQLTGYATADLKDVEVMAIVSDLATQLTGIERINFTTLMNDRSMEMTTRKDFKYSCSRGVHSTPMFTVNDIFVDASSFTWQQWKNYIDYLLN